MEYAGATAWYFSTVAAYVPTNALKNIFSMPFRTSDYLFQQQTHAPHSPQPLRVQITTREDGRSKKRLVDVDPAAPVSTASSDSESGSQELPSSQAAAAAPSQVASSSRVLAQPGGRWRARAALATEVEANIRSTPETGSRWRARATEPVTLMNHTSPLLAHIALKQLRSKTEPNNYISPLLSRISSLRSKTEPGNGRTAQATPPLHTHTITRTKPSRTTQLTVGLPESVEERIWCQPVVRQSDEDYLLSSPDSSPLARRTSVRFEDHVRVKPITPRRKIPDDEYYRGDPEVNAVVDYELNLRRKVRERARERARRALEEEDGGSSSEFKQEVDSPPKLTWASPKMLPPSWMYEDILDKEEQAAEEQAAEDAEVDAMLYSKEVAANTVANENVMDIDEPNDFLGGESSSEFKYDVGSSPLRPPTPIDQSMRYLQLAEEAIDDSILIASSPPPFPIAPTTSITPLVAPLTKIELESLNKIAQHAAANDRAIVAELPTIKLTTHDFGTLVPTKFNGPAKGWLNDNIIDEYLDLLVGHVKKKEGYVHVRGKNGVAPPVHAFKSQWYTSMQKSTENTARWARPVNLSEQKLLDCGLVLIPICDHSHWRLVAIKPKQRLVEYYDSLLGNGAHYTKQALEWVKLVLKDHYIEEEWSVVDEGKSEEQVNARDCGVFTILNALVLLRGEEHSRVLVTDGMDDARLRIATSLVAGTPTTEFY